MKIERILIVSFGDTGNEPEAIRQVLEGFNFFVGIKYIGRPNDFIEVLNGELPFEADCLIFSCHGENGKIIMPFLGQGVYEEKEPRGNFSFNEVNKHIKLYDKFIISLGCTTGTSEMSNVFSKHNTYIAPSGYVDGKAALFFSVKLFYEIVQNNKSIDEAYILAKENDTETNLFKFAKRR